MSNQGIGGVSVTAASRLRKDYNRLMRDPVPFVMANPLPSNILEWHYVVRGPPNSPFEGGVYHGKLVFPADFPFKPPSIYMITPNGRFQVNYRLCLSISDYHPDTWNPAWTVSTILTGLLSFMLETSPTLGSIQTSDFEKRVLAKKSREHNLQNKNFMDLFPELSEELRGELSREAAESDTHDGGGVAAQSSTSGLDHSITYNLLVLVGVVALAFAVRYVLLAAEDSH